VLEKLFRSPLLHLVQRVEGRSRSGGIVWPHTAAFSEELNHFPAVYINVRGREPYGTVSPGMEYESVRDAVIGHMHDWHDPDTGTPVVRSAWRREQLYEGAQVGRAPDIVLELNEDCGYSYMCLPYTRFQEHETVKRFPRDMLTGNRQMSMSGSHRPEGIFLVSGSRTRRAGKLPHHVDIQDICPTVLSFFGIPVPDYIDGRAIPVFCGQQIQAGAGREEQVDGAAHETPYTREQEKKIARRLRNLGYID
jgi:predicted AlkP superfamily phosphohydrolase/phosphomutase